MVARPGMDSVFQLQDNQLTVEYKASNRLYRFVSVRRSSWNFKSSNYVADSRRRTKLKFRTTKVKIHLPINSQLIPSEQLLYLLWCKSSPTTIMSSGKPRPNKAGSTNQNRLAASTMSILNSFPGKFFLAQKSS